MSSTVSGWVAPGDKTRIENLHKNDSNISSRLINSFEGFAIDDSSAFSRIRATLKETGDMFLFGKPTPDLVTIILKMYHENYIRNLCFLDEDSIVKSSREFFAGRLLPQNHVPFMCGMIQMNDGQIYMTVSEAPKFGDRVEDDIFNIKEEAMIDILSACNIKVKFPEDDMDMTDEMYNIVQETHRLNSGSKTRWRKYVTSSPTSGILDPSKFATYEPHLLIKNEKRGEGDGSRTGINYNNELWEKKMSVNIINSYN